MATTDEVRRSMRANKNKELTKYRYLAKHLVKLVDEQPPEMSELSEELKIVLEPCRTEVATRNPPRRPTERRFYQLENYIIRWKYERTVLELDKSFGAEWVMEL